MGARRVPLRLLCFAIFLLAVSIRVAWLPTMSRADLTSNTVTPDGHRSFDECINVALSLYNGNGFADPFWGGLTGPSAHCAPAFPAVTAAIFRVFGPDDAGALARDMLNIAGYALLFALMPLFSARLGMTTAPGLVAGFAAALFPLYGQREMSTGRDEWLAALIGVLLTLYALRLARGEAITRRAALAYGAGWGALMYVHPAMVAILPLHMLVILFARARPSRQRVAFAGIVPAAFLLVVLPWIVRDRIAMGGWMFMRDDLGMELEVSNGDGATPAVRANIATGWFCSQHPNCSHPVALRVLAAGEREFNREAMATAISWIESHPARFAGLTVRRVVAFWIGERYERGVVVWRIVLSFLGLAGFWLMWRGGLRIEAALLGAFWIAYPAAFYLIQRIDRYQAPMYPAILLPAGFASVALWQSMRKKLARQVMVLQLYTGTAPMAQNGGTGELMKANRVPGVGGIVLLAAFAMGTSAQASTLSGVVATSTDGALHAAVVARAGSFGISAISHAVNVPPEPASFLLAGLTLAVLPLIRKRRGQARKLQSIFAITVDRSFEVATWKRGSVTEPRASASAAH